MGSDYFWEILEGERVVLPSSLLLLSSKFGYILTGKYNDPKAGAGEGVSTCVSTIYNPCLSDMWNLDSIGIHESPNVKEDDRALEESNRTRRSVTMLRGHGDPQELNYQIISVLPLGG